MLQGILLDLVPYDERFRAQEVTWINGPMRAWWGMDGLLTRARNRRNHEEPEAYRERNIQFGMLAKDGTPIGTFALMHIDACQRHAEVGAGIGDPAYWGGGYGSDAMLLIVEYAFEWLDLRRLYLTTMAHNVRAQQQVEKCGFRREGSRRHWQYLDGRRIDMLVYGLLRDEWPGRAALIEHLGLRDRANRLRTV